MSDESKMDAKTLEALKGSIAKWEKIVAGNGGDEGEDNCPLCKVFLVGQKTICIGCPVFASTGAHGCLGSPYENWVTLNCEYDSDDGDPWFADTPELIAAAQAELDFLKSLLPEGERS